MRIRKMSRKCSVLICWLTFACCLFSLFALGEQYLYDFKELPESVQNYNKNAFGKPPNNCNWSHPGNIYRSSSERLAVFELFASESVEYLKKITKRDMLRSVVLRPDLDWIAPIARQGSLRILLLGGSNTENVIGYSSFLELNVRDVIDTDTWRNESYVINAGISGHGPTFMRFPFEDSLPPAQWPNLVILEFSVNIPFSWTSILTLDKEIYFMNKKYAKRGVEPPRYLFIDIWRPYMLIDYSKNCVKETDKDVLIKRLQGPFQEGAVSTPVFRGADVSINIQTLARHYGYPLVGTMELFWPAFVEHYLEEGQCRNETMPLNYSTFFALMPDNTHLWCYAGSFLSMKIIFPLIKGEIEQFGKSGRLSATTTTTGASGGGGLVGELNDDDDDVTYVDPHTTGDFLFPAEHYSAVDVLYSVIVWGTDRAVTFPMCLGSSSGIADWTESPICVLDHSQAFDYIQIGQHDDHLHTAFASSQPNAMVSFILKTHAASPKANKNIDFFHIQLEYVVSWDKSTYGGMVCNLREGLMGWGEAEWTNSEEDGKTDNVVRGGESIELNAGNCNGLEVKSTGVCSAILPVGLQIEKSYKLNCKQTDGKVVGITGITLLFIG